MKVRVRLKRVHFHNGFRKVPGNVIRVNEKSAGWLIQRGVAEPVKRPR